MRMAAVDWLSASELISCPADWLAQLAGLQEGFFKHSTRSVQFSLAAFNTSLNIFV